MLETVRKCIRKKEPKSFNERFVDYIISVQDKSILLEMEYIKKHNKLDALNLDKWVGASLQEAMKS